MPILIMKLEDLKKESIMTYNEFQMNNFYSDKHMMNKAKKI